MKTQKLNKKSLICQYTKEIRCAVLKKKDRGERMATYEELLEIIIVQQETIEKLTAELIVAREEIAELKEKEQEKSGRAGRT